VKDVFGQFLILSILTVIIYWNRCLSTHARGAIWLRRFSDLRLDAYEHLQELELAYFEERSTGRLISILSDDINQLEQFLDVGANDLIQVSTTVVVVGCFLYSGSRCGMDGNAMPFILWVLAFQRLLAPRYGCARGESPQLSAGKQSDGHHDDQKLYRRKL